jgi:WD40 repeat protein
MFHSKLKALAATFGITAALIGGGFVAAGMVDHGDELPPTPVPKEVAAAPAPKKAESPQLFRGILKGHKGTVASVAVSSHAKMIVSGSYDGTVKAWDALTGKELIAIDAFQSCVGSIAIHPNGKLVAATCAGSPVPGKDLTTIKVWDLSTGKRAMMLEGHKTMGAIVSYSPDGKVLASGGVDVVKLWDAATGKELQTIKGHDGWINSLVFNADGKLLASKCNGGLIKIRDVASGKELATNKDMTSFGHMAFSHDGKSIANLVDDNRVVVYALVENKLVERFGITAGKKGERIHAIVFSPDGKTFATGDDEGSIRLWDASEGKQVKLFQGHKDAVQSLAFSPDGKTLVSGGHDETVQMWNAVGD